MFYLWGTPLELDEEKLDGLKLEHHVVMSSSERAWTIAEDIQQLSNDAIAEPPEGDRKQYPLMAVIEGQFPDAFEGKERPKWPKPEQPPGRPPLPEPEDEEEPPAKPAEAKPAKLILLGCSEMFRKNFLQADNLDLFLNCVDAVSLNENLVHVRGRKAINRVIGDIPAGKKAVWRLTNYGLANLVIAVAGIAVFLIRRASRNAYTMAHLSD